MSTTRVQGFARAPRRAVYAACVDGAAVGRWLCPDGMRSVVHAFDGRVGGAFRISLTYDDATAAGKSHGATDTFAGRVVALEPDARVVWEVAFEAADAALAAPMTITIALADAPGGAGRGTVIDFVHEGVPAAVAPADNERGTRMALAKLAALVEGR